MENVIGLRITNYLKATRKTIKEMANALNINEHTLGNKIRGSRKMEIDLVANILNNYEDLSADWLLLGRGPMLRTQEYIVEPVHYNQVNDDGDNISGYGNTVNKDNSRVVALLERQLEEEKARSREYWNTIQLLINK